MHELDYDPLWACWLAGIIDGEGCVGVYNRASIQISNTNKALLEKCVRIVGNPNRGLRPVKRQKAHHKPAWTISWTSKDDICQISNMTRHFLIAKRKQMALVAEYHWANNARRKELHTLTLELNRRGEKTCKIPKINATNDPVFT